MKILVRFLIFVFCCGILLKGVSLGLLMLSAESNFETFTGIIIFLAIFSCGWFLFQYIILLLIEGIRESVVEEPAIFDNWGYCRGCDCYPGQCSPGCHCICHD